MHTVEDIRSLYYTTHIDNLPSILEKGILSRTAVIAQGIYVPQKDISSSDIQERRAQKGFLSPRTHKRRKLHNYVPTYIQPNNAFIVDIQNDIPRDQLCVIRITSKILQDRKSEIVLTTKNAACSNAKFHAPPSWAPSPGTSTALTSAHLSGLESTTWVGSDKFRESKQKRQSEALLPDKIDPRYFDSILVHNAAVQQQIETILEEKENTLPVIIHSTLFPTPIKGVFSKKLSLQADPLNPVRLFSPIKTIKEELDEEASTLTNIINGDDPIEKKRKFITV